MDCIGAGGSGKSTILKVSRCLGYAD